MRSEQYSQRALNNLCNCVTELIGWRQYFCPSPSEWVSLWGKCNAPINVKPEGGGRAWGGDLIVFVVPGVGHLTDLGLPGEGIFESFFARRGDIWLPTRTKKTETEHVSRFYASRTRHMVWKDKEVMEANESKRRLSGLHCFVFKFRLF